MPKLPTFKLNQYAYFIFVFIVIPILISAIGFAFLHLQKRTLIEEKRGDLATIADLKVANILQWRKERIVEANSIHNNAMMSEQIYEFVTGKHRPYFLDDFRTWAENLTDISGYRRVLLFTPTGKLIVSHSEKNASLTLDYRPMINMVTRDEQIILTDFYLEQSTDTISINLVVPIIYSRSGDPRLIAVLVLEMDPYQELFPIIQSWPNTNQSAETLLVRQEGNDVLFLNDLRFLKNAAMKYRRPLSLTNLPAVRAALGEEGDFEGIDYRGVSVQSATRTIPGSTWSIVAKIDTSEAAEPMSAHVWYVVTACIALISSLVLGVSLWWKRKEKDALLEKYESEIELNFELSSARTELQKNHAELEKRVEERTGQLQKSQELFSNLSSQVPGLLFQFQMFPDGSYSFPFVSNTVNSFSGVSAEEISNKPDILFDMIQPDDFEGVMHAIKESARTMLPWHHEFRTVSPHNHIYWRSVLAKPHLQNDGSIVWSGFISDITENKQLANELYEAKKLESIGQIAGGVAHEVRNPLNAILSITEALFREKEIENNPEFIPYIQHIRTQVNRLANLMNDLLDLGKGIPVSSIMPIPLFELCSETISIWMASGNADNKQIMLICHQEHRNLKIMADSGKMQQILFNLVENAAQHSPKGSKVYLEISGVKCNDSGESAAIVKVVDEGKGITPDKLTRVFDPFYSDRKGGTGLGLALVKHFIENMGGAVTISNNTPLPGCTVEIEIPIAEEGQK